MGKHKERFEVGESVGNINRLGRLAVGEDLILEGDDGFMINIEQKDVILAFLISYKIKNNISLDPEEQEFCKRHKSRR